MSLTIEQKSNFAGFPKPGELIEMIGTHTLETCDRAVLNILYQHAHDSGRVGDLAAEWELPIAEIREALSRHGSNDRLRDSLKRLKQLVVTIHYTDEEGEARILLTSMFEFFDLPEKEGGKHGKIRYALPRKLVPVLARSGRWGRIKAEVVCAMTSKHAIALYELLQLRANLERTVEVFPIERFRELLGVPPETYARSDNLMRKVIAPALLQVNGLSDIGVQIKPGRRNSRSPIDSMAVAWWRKEGDDFREAYKERQRPKVGRMARLRGQVETEVTDAFTGLPSAADHAEMAARLDAMRQPLTVSPSLAATLLPLKG